VSDTDEFRYTTASFGDQQLLGAMDGAKILPEGVPSQWTIFFGAKDVDKTLEVISDKGGVVLRPAEDTPYGRLAAAADPTGMMFNLSSLQNEVTMIVERAAGNPFFVEAATITDPMECGAAVGHGLLLSAAVHLGDFALEIPREISAVPAL
jgi:predicted enzyme related to lactoylglutathione lyase